MGNLYKIFNDLKLDDPLQEQTISESEVKRIKHHVFNQLPDKQNNNKLYLVALITTLVIASNIIFALINPTVARNIPIVGDMFSWFSSDDIELMGDRADYLTAIDLTDSSNGITVTVTDALYDGERISVAYDIRTDRDLGEYLYVDFLEVEGNKELISSYPSFVRKVADNQYTGLETVELAIEDPADSIQVWVRGQEISWSKQVEDDKRDVKEQETIEGNWSIAFNLDLIDNEKIEINQQVVNDEFIDIQFNDMILTPISSYFSFSHAIHLARLREQLDFHDFYVNYQIIDDLGNIYYPNHHQEGHVYANTTVTMPVFAEDIEYIEVKPILHISYYEENWDYSWDELELESFRIYHR
ncbi:DUF4179 domain-containing protein [Amphibacillus cookii]|uniref:DUF4179 domain-containing protein n=1 Tax=Amphibacillus cookii TaxID=767787 RepID=UPI00195F0E96|nr:DUF4179 domain-containing protein [Amphibacillus cookii]MBM7542699.1 hypothetical protein [Amphibacillus cookii]